ncbi:2623_t:CDS:2, partial [Acaulospora morrowiae]
MNVIQTSETPRERRNRLSRNARTCRRLTLTVEQLEQQRTQQREKYRRRTEAETEEHAERRRITRREAYRHHVQQRQTNTFASNAARMQEYDTGTVICHKLGEMNVECSQCQALHWIEEKVAGSIRAPIFGMCCAKGKVKLPPIGQPPVPLLNLLIDEDSRSHLDPITLEQLQAMLNEVNPYVHVFQQAAHILQENFTQDLNLVIIKARSEQQYTVPVASEIAILMVGDGQEFEPSNRDIVLRIQGGGLQRISQTHQFYSPLHYVLLFPRGEPGWHSNIPICNTTQVNSNDTENEDLQDEDTKLRRVTMMQYYSYHLQIRQLESFVLHRSGRLFQQYIVDAYVCIEQNRLNYLNVIKNKFVLNCIVDYKMPSLFVMSCLKTDHVLVIELYFHPALLNTQDFIYLTKRSILTPRNVDVDALNAEILAQFPGEEKTYYSADTLDRNSE